MATVTQIIGNDGSSSLQGTSGPDLIYGFDPDGPTANLASIAATRVATGLSQPVAAVAAPGDINHLFIVERTGTIRVLDLQSGATSLFLDISASITTIGEGGLLGLAFDPGYAENGLFYVNVTNPADDTEVRRYQKSATDPLQADAASLLTLITVDQPAGLTNHKAGWLGFGPDGLLYIPMGDGGGGGDPFDNAQNPQSLLGKILRLDVHSDAFPGDATRNYAVPADNPFVGVPGILPEIWALGLRNPFRAGFDRDTGALFIGDVGQGAIEEIDIGASGANYGWDVFEGLQGFESGPLGPGTLTDPIHTYGRTVGATVIGGYVHRGEGDALQGQYFFADFITGRIFTLRQQGGTWIATEQTLQIAAGAIDNPAAFGEDAAGNLYIVDFDGDVFRLGLDIASADLGDIIDGAGGNDTIHAGAGADLLTGGDGNDVLHGGSGDDTLNGGVGSDTLNGGVGRDVAVFNSTKAQTVLTNNHDGSWTAAGPDGTDTLVKMEVARFTDGDSILSPALHDINGDGRADLILQNSASGDVAAWQMSGLSILSAGVLPASPGMAWHMGAVGDINGDGRADLIFQNGTSGDVAAWEMNGLSILAAGVLPASPGTEWQSRNTGDLNGDGEADIILQNSTSGDVAVWEMNGLSIIAAGVVAASPGTAWQLKVTGDVNGDWNTDLIFQNSTSGDVAVWEMSGMSIIAAGVVAASPGTAWQLKGAGDLNGNGNSDLIFQHSTSGDVAAWEMNGLSILAAGVLPASPSSEWQVQTTGDLNGDGRADMAFQHVTSGDVAVWEMNGFSITAAAAIAAAPGTEWELLA